MEFNLPVFDIKFFIGMIHIIKVNIIYLIWHPNYIEFIGANCWYQIIFTIDTYNFEEFNLAPILLISNFLYEWYISLELSK